MCRFWANVAATLAFFVLCHAVQAICIQSALKAKKQQDSQEFTCVKDGLFRNPKNCNHLIECSGGQPYLMQCPPGLHYSTGSERCEDPCNAYCNQTLACDCGWSSCVTTVPDSVPADFVCEEDGLYRYPDSCTDYISCEGETAYPGSCPGGLHFSDISRQCVVPCEAFCDNSLACECHWPSCEKRISVAKALEEEFHCTEDGVYPDPKDCAKHYYCAHGKSYHLTCDSLGRFHFDPVHKSCVTPCEAKCDPSFACKCFWPSCNRTLSASEQEAILVAQNVEENLEFSEPSQEELGELCTEDDFLTYPHSCSHYVKCVGGRALVTSCPTGLHFNNVTKGCEEPCEASCDESLACHCGWKSCKMENSPLCEFDCIQDGIYRNPSSCFSYVQCSNGIAHVMRCPANLHFNEKTKMCDYPCKAKCDHTLGCQCGWPSCSSGVCSLPLKEGNCTGHFPRWYYDGATSQCQRYVYRGCNGNENSFLSREECEKRCSNYICDLPADEGSCMGYYPRYYFNKGKSVCERFVYGGCEGNENRFKTQEECEQKCGEASMSDVNVCSLKKDSGRCYASEPRYYFDEEEGRCRKFIYSGCGGNGNNFETKKQCEQSCLGVKSIPNRGPLQREQKSSAEVTPPFYCLLPPKFGTCNMEVWGRYFYDPTTKECQYMYYGGCDGNSNNFRNMGECEQVCMGKTDQKMSRFQCSKNGIYPIKGKCSSYIICRYDEAYTKECPPGLHFSAQIKQCVVPCEAQCDPSIDC